MQFFTPGPASLYPTVQRHLQQALTDNIPSISHRSAAYQELHRRAVDGVRRIMGAPEKHRVYFFSSATEIWERLLQNCVRTHTAHCVNGAFSNRFAYIAQQLQKTVYLVQAPEGSSFNFDRLELPNGIEMLNVTHNETSTGVMIDLPGVYPLRDRHPEALLTVDMVSSTPYEQPDWTKVDAAYFSVQKCFGLPAGLGVLVAGPRVLARAQSLEADGLSVGSYHRFTNLEKYAQRNQTPATPNVLNIYLLGHVVEDMLARGQAQLRRETDEKAAMLYDFIARQPRLSPYVALEADRSPTVIVAEVAGGSKDLRSALRARGFVVGDGYGENKGKQLRIANFPAKTVAETEDLIDALKLAL